MKKDKWLWILGGGLMQIASIAEAQALGLKTIISDMNKDCVCADMADQFVHLDIYDIDTHLKALKSLRAQGLNIQGVFCAGIDCPETAAAMQEYLGRPTAPREIARICHNKREFRQAMRVLEYPTPHIKNKVIVKTQLEGAGSRGASIYPDNGWLVENLWEGTEHTVETLFDIHGKFHPCFITDRIFDYSNGFALEVGLRHPTTLPEYVQRKAFKIAESMARDLGIERGPFKLDIIVTEDGVRVIEATTRFSGGFDCQYLVPTATGKNILRAGILTAIGLSCMAEYTLIPKWDKVALSQSLWPEPGIIKKIDGVEEAWQIPGVKHIIFRKKVGDTVGEYIDCTQRVCFIITSGDTEEEARVAMDKARNTIKIRMAT